ncbi:probable E3 ubiquitin-protein ligase RHA4A isoform X2 [Vigna unguiculata]|uniref:probable E3 ubiquitin-protein ligase RHA4A isoform X2 n=1 Tax=Vigna unguiculata TaxID=3917 RepID=UPI001016E4AF|nr:probable E3 ubiquitin-protein ligase RHA4A isoform X2 [Vigna unguiculata]
MSIPQAAAAAASASASAASSPPPHLYPQELQLKLYQAFIFSIPILFSIILFLLFYLFYLKRRASSSPYLLPRTIPINPPTTTPYHSSPCQFLDKLPRVLFDEDLLARDSFGRYMERKQRDK